MSKPLVLLGCTTLVFAGASFALWRQFDLQRDELTVAQARIRELERVPPARSNDALAEPREASPDEPPPTSRRAPGPSSAAQAGAHDAEGEQRDERGRTDQRSRRQWLLRDPEVRAARVDQDKQWFLRGYAELSTLLGWDRETVERLAALRAEQSLRNRQMTQAMPNNESGEALPAAWGQKFEEDQRRADAEVAALLGAQKLKEWQEYQRTTGARTVARQLRNMLEGSAQPLEESQMPSLVRALADAEQNGDDIRAANPIAARGGPRSSAERITMLEKQIEMNTSQNKRLHEAVAPYLSPAQLTRYDEMNRMGVERLRSQLRVSHATQNVEKRGAPRP